MLSIINKQFEKSKLSPHTLRYTCNCALSQSSKLSPAAFFSSVSSEMFFLSDEVLGNQRRVYYIQNLTGLKLKRNGKSFVPEICKERRHVDYFVNS